MLVNLIKKIAAFAWLLPGFLLWAAYPPMGECMDALFALAPLIWLSRNGGRRLELFRDTTVADPKARLRDRPVRRAVRRWFLNGFLFWFATLSWMPAIVKNNGPWPLVVLGWAGLAAYCALYFAAFGWLSTLYWRRARGTSLRLLGILVVEPVLWCGLELLRSRLMGGFAWNHLGVVAVNSGFGAPAALGGVYLCSAVIFLVNGTIAGIAERFLSRFSRGEVDAEEIRRPRLLRSLETFLVFGVIYGIYSLPVNQTIQQSPNPPIKQSNNQTIKQSNNTLSVALIQRNFPCCFKEEDEENPVDVYRRLAGSIATLGPDIVVLSESAFCEVGRVDTASAMRFASWLREQTGAKAVLAGGTRTEGRQIFNSAALYIGEEPPQIYDKVHLVPFGEFIPGDKLFPWLARFAPVGSCTAGVPRLLELKLMSSAAEPSAIGLGTAICFEDTDSALCREYARMGAQALVFITNDSWFSHSQETWQHAWQARARAIETGLPVIRVGNSGVTGVIRPDGRVGWLCGEDGHPLTDAAATMFERVRIDASTAGSSPGTPYVRCGDWPLGIAFALLITAMIMVYLNDNYEKRRTLSMQVG